MSSRRGSLRWRLVGLGGLGALACGGTRPRAPEPALIEVQADDSDSGDTPVDAGKPGDVSARIRFEAAAPIALRRFLEDFMKELVRHDFRRLLQRFDQQNLAAQRRLGVDDEQYLREALIPYWSRARVDEAPADEDAPRFTSGDLRRVQAVLIDRVDNLDSHRERYRVSGMLELSGSVRFVFQLEVRRIGERYVADPPVG
ncbi:MAG: hypothetical protein R3B89_31830 [Polyangiaceae bacterium]